MANPKERTLQTLELAVTDMDEAIPEMELRGYPPYPPYPQKAVPPSIADTIIAGRDIRQKFKYSTPQKSARPPPKPAKPKGPKATDVKMSKKMYKAHSRCLRRHGAVLSDRLEYMAKPRRRNIIYLWREHADILPPETIARIRSMLDADEPFKPDQAYEYFVNLRKTKKKKNKKRAEQLKKDMIALCDEKRFLWARNATIAFARGIQQRLSRPRRYALADGMLRLSNVILDDVCGFMKMKTPMRNSINPKARFMMEMSDKIAVWIDEILVESDDRMLMMDYDEDEDIAAADGAGDAGFDDDFLKMMRSGDGSSSPAYLKFTGDMLEAFTILTNAMFKKGDENLTEYGKFKQSFAEAAKLLRETPSFEVREIIISLVQPINQKLTDTVKDLTPEKLEPAMHEIISICSLFLAENADFNKLKGPAFKALVQALHKKPNDLLFDSEKIKETYGEAARDLIQARGLDSDHDDPNLTKTIQSNLVKLVKGIVEPDMQTDMDETIDVCSKYLSQNAVDKVERGPAFDLLIKILVERGADPFTPQYEQVETKFAAAHALETAPGLTSLPVNDQTKPEIEEKLHKAVDLATPKEQKKEMDDIIQRGANYLSGYIRDREKALQLLLDTMKKNASKELVKRNDYAMSYGTAADEIEKSPVMVPYLPVKDIKEEIEHKLERDVKSATPSSLKIPMKSLVRDVAGVLSQPVALKSDAAGEEYPRDLLIAVKKAQGAKPLYEYKGYKETYANAAETLKNTVTTEDDIKNEKLKSEIDTELNTALPPKLLPTIASEIQKPVEEASDQLATIGTKRGDALEHITELIKEKGEAPLARLQGYEQTHADAARRIEDAPTLVNEKVDKTAYPKVKEKIQKLTEAKPTPEKVDKEQLSEMVDQTAKFLAAPVPEVESEKRRLLADLMGREGDKKLAEEGIYKVTFKEGAQEVMEAPATPFKVQDESFKSNLKDKVKAVLPDKQLEVALGDTVKDAADNLASIVKGRGEVIKLLQEGMKKEKDTPLVEISGEVVQLIKDDMKKEKKTPAEAAKIMKEVPTSSAAGRHVDQVNMPSTADNQYHKTNIEAADIIKGAPNLTAATDDVNKVLMGTVTESVKKVPIALTSVEAKDHFEEGVETVSKYIAAVAAKEIAEGKTGGIINELSASPGKKMRKWSADSSKRTMVPIIKEQANQHDEALNLLHEKLKARGNEIFYKQPRNELTYAQASEWLTDKPFDVDMSVKDSVDTGRLHKKFERKLSSLVAGSTPPDMQDVMQDVIIETSRELSEMFMTKSYGAMARDAVISEMQKRCNDNLIGEDDDTETFFYAAQRLKNTNSLQAEHPNERGQHHLNRKLDEMIKSRNTLRKLSGHIKDYVQNASKYLSEHVNEPEKEINAYIALLTEMEAAGDRPLVDGKIKKSHRDAANYLRELTTFDDEINLDDESLQQDINSKLQKLMENVSPVGYDKDDMKKIIERDAKLFTSYVKQQGVKTDALKVLVGEMDNEDDNVLLRHGTLRKTYRDGANILRPKTADQLKVTVNVDPVVFRKIQIKLKTLMNQSFHKYNDVMGDVVQDATSYLALQFLQPEIIQVCKCYKSVCVQCELWSKHILRHKAKRCTCSRHGRLADVCPSRYYISGSGSHICDTGLQVTISQCSSKRKVRPPLPRPASKPSCSCNRDDTTAAYLLYTSHGPFDNIPTKLTVEDTQNTSTGSRSFMSYLDSIQSITHFASEREDNFQNSTSINTLDDILGTNSNASYLTYTAPSVIVPPRTYGDTTNTMCTQAILPITTTKAINDIHCGQRCVQSRNEFSSKTPIVATDQMSDWYSMMISLMWNVQAWRVWIKDNIEKLLTFQKRNELDDTWIDFERKSATETMQWYYYNQFSQQLVSRMASNYNDKKIVSPTRTTVKTKIFLESYGDMLEIINNFNKWTKWLNISIKETDVLLRCNDSSSERRRILKEKVDEHLEEWKRYDSYLSLIWEIKFKSQISDWVCGLQQPGPMWVVSACGAVPSGAVAAGLDNGEVIWVARTTHKCKVLPAALYPSKHCCVLYWGGKAHHYTKYQVMCNASVQWLAWRAGSPPEGAVRVGEAHVGRVHYRNSHLLGPVIPPRYRCHVLMFGHLVPFQCYELLVSNET